MPVGVQDFLFTRTETNEGEAFNVIEPLKKNWIFWYFARWFLHNNYFSNQNRGFVLGRMKVRGAAKRISFHVFYKRHWNSFCKSVWWIDVMSFGVTYLKINFIPLIKLPSQINNKFSLTKQMALLSTLRLHNWSCMNFLGAYIL